MINHFDGVVILTHYLLKNVNMNTDLRPAKKYLSEIIL